MAGALRCRASLRLAQPRRLVRCCSTSSGGGRSVLRRLAREQASGERSALEIAESYLAAAEASQPSLRAFLAVTGESARRSAAAVDAARRAGCALGPLAGVPLGVKDNLCTRGVATTAGSRLLEGYVPPYDATAWARLAAAGAVLVGKTNMDEFGMGSSTEGSAFGATTNPWGSRRVPGGSSGGSAAAVAASLAAAAIGSDTGGSVRQPATFCGVVGLKPTYGRVSRSGLVAYASSLDTVGPIGVCVEDCALLLSAMAGRDDADATSSDQPVDDFAAALLPPEALPSSPLAGVRIGVVTEACGAGVSSSVLSSLAEFADHARSLGATVAPVSLPTFSLGLPAYYVLAPAEASSNLARFDGLRFGVCHSRPSAAATASASRAAGFGEEVKRRILTGTYVLSAGYADAYYARAQSARRLLRDEMTAALGSHDVLLTPGAPAPAFKLGANTRDPLAMKIGDITTVAANLAGLPAIALPSGLAAPEGEGDGARLPVGVQLIGRAWGEAHLLRIAHILEVTRPPTVGSPPGWPTF